MKRFIKNLQINKTKKTLLLVLLFISFWSIAFATSGTIWNLFNLYTGSENGVTVTNEYRLIWTNIRDDTITTYEIQDWTILSSDLAPWVWSKWSSNASDIYYNNGNVGIGTNTPRSKLDVVWGDLKINWATLDWDNVALTNISNDDLSTQIIFKDKQNTEYGSVYWYWNWGSFGLLDWDRNWWIRMVKDLYTLFLVNGLEKMRIQSNGNVGIWTTSPTSKLEVNWIIKTSSGWIKFPDNTIQTTAANWINSWFISGMIQAGCIVSYKKWLESPECWNGATWWSCWYAAFGELNQCWTCPWSTTIKGNLVYDSDSNSWGLSSFVCITN